jgi:hypothetical protein
LMPACLRNMSSSLVTKKLDMVGAVSSSSGTKYSLQHGATWNRARIRVWSVNLEEVLPLSSGTFGGSL